MVKKKIAIFASGSGTNAENIIKYFKNNDLAVVSLILCNNGNAGVIKRAEKLDVPVFVFNREQLKTGVVLDKIQKSAVDFIVLAGFLWLMPSEITRGYKDKIINIHPALLPKYGGKGMYGMNVHNAIIQNGDIESGITIHWVNGEYDKGSVIFQAKCSIEMNDTPEILAGKVHKLEYEHFPRIIEEIIKQLK